jgi:hypothetical protein
MSKQNRKRVSLFDFMDMLRIQEIGNSADKYVDLGDSELSKAVALMLKQFKIGHYIEKDGHYLYFNGFCATSDDPLQQYRFMIHDIWPKS